MFKSSLVSKNRSKTRIYSSWSVSTDFPRENQQLQLTPVLGKLHAIRSIDVGTECSVDNRVIFFLESLIRRHLFGFNARKWGTFIAIRTIKRLMKMGCPGKRRQFSTVNCLGRIGMPHAVRPLSHVLGLKLSTSNYMDILVIEDNVDDAFLLTRQLVRAHIDHFRVIGSGDLAYDFLNDTDIVPLVIFLDINLPGISGLELFDKLRKIPRLASVPVFVMSTSLSPEALAECQRLGFSGFLTKPIDLTTFIKHVSHLFQTPAAT